jgi:hypothetical protein
MLRVDEDLTLERPLDHVAVARLSNDEVARQLDLWHQVKAIADGHIVQLLGEATRRQGFRDDGAASARDWQVERFGASVTSARNYGRVAERMLDLPHLTEALSTGDISLDKMRAVAPVATPENERELARKARECTVIELREVADSLRRRKGPPPKPDPQSKSLRFNEACRTMSVQFPSEEFAEVRALVESQA